MARKYIFYLKGVPKPIVLTDNKNVDMTLDEIAVKVSEVMADIRIGKFATDTDVLLVRPEDITGVHITNDLYNREDTNKEKESIDTIFNDAMSITPEIDLSDLQPNTPEMDLSDLPTDSNLDEIQEGDSFSEDSEFTENIPEEIIDGEN